MAVGSTDDPHDSDYIELCDGFQSVLLGTRQSTIAIDCSIGATIPDPRCSHQPRILRSCTFGGRQRFVIQQVAYSLF